MLADCRDRGGGDLRGGGIAVAELEPFCALALPFWAVLFFEATAWDAAWISLNTGRPGYALLKATLVPQMITPAVIMSLQAGVWGYWGNVLIGFPYGTVGEAAVVILLLLIPILVMSFNTQGRRRFGQIHEELRWIAQHPPPESSDPRLSRWNAREHFPFR